MLESLLQELATLLDTNVAQLKPETDLDSFANWDSLTRVTLIGFLIDHHKLTIDIGEFEKIQTIGDLIKLTIPDYVEALV